jgi:radical SAM superfamily enzyme
LNEFILAEKVIKELNENPVNVFLKENKDTITFFFHKRYCEERHSVGFHEPSKCKNGGEGCIYCDSMLNPYNELTKRDKNYIETQVDKMISSVRMTIALNMGCFI